MRMNTFSTFLEKYPPSHSKAGTGGRIIVDAKGGLLGFLTLCANHVRGFLFRKELFVDGWGKSIGSRH